MNNLLTYSDDLAGGIWIKADGTVVTKGHITAPIYYGNSATKSITINYSNSSSYTIKTEGYAQITRVNDKREYKLHIDYLRKPVTVKSSADYLVKELEPVKERVELKLKDVKSVSVREDDRTITLTKFK